MWLHSPPPYSGPNYSDRFLPSEQPVSPGKYCGKLCKSLQKCSGRQVLQSFSHPPRGWPCHRRSGWPSRTCLSETQAVWAQFLSNLVHVAWWHSRSSAPRPSPAPRSGWQDCVPLYRWASHWLNSSQVGFPQLTSDYVKWRRVAWRALPAALSVPLGESHLGSQTCLCLGCGHWPFPPWSMELHSAPCSHLPAQGLGTWRISGLTVKDQSKEGIKYLSLSPSLCHTRSWK